MSVFRFYDMCSGGFRKTEYTAVIVEAESQGAVREATMRLHPSSTMPGSYDELRAAQRRLLRARKAVALAARAEAN